MRSSARLMDVYQTITMDINLMKSILMTLFGLALSAASTNGLAAGLVENIEVEGDIVLFSISEAKQGGSSPACVLESATETWSISLDSQSGRATYSMLVTAMSLNIAVNVESANDCANSAGIERAGRVWFENS